MNLANDVARCGGFTEHGAAQPVQICRTCERWLNRTTGGTRTPHIEAAAGVHVYTDSTVMHCDNRIAAD